MDYTVKAVTSVFAHGVTGSFTRVISCRNFVAWLGREPLCSNYTECTEIPTGSDMLLKWEVRDCNGSQIDASQFVSGHYEILNSVREVIYEAPVDLDTEDDNVHGFLQGSVSEEYSGTYWLVLTLEDIDGGTTVFERECIRFPLNYSEDCSND